MKTPMQELIEQLNELEAKLTSLDDAMYRGGVRNAKRLAEELLEKEKEFMQKVYANAKATGEMDEAVRNFNI